MLHGARVIRILAVCIVVVQPFCLRGQQSPAPGNVDPKADAVMRALANHLASAKTISVSVNALLRMTARGMNNEMASTYDVAVERPDKIAIIQKDGMFGVSAASDGTTLTVYNSMMKSYTAKPAPKTVDEIAEEITSEFASSPGQMLFSAGMWGSKPYESIMDGVTSGVYVAKIDLDGTACHHLRYAQEGFDWDAWVTVATPPLLVKMTADMSRQMEAARESVPGMADIKMVVDVAFSNWKFNEPVSPAVFQFTPPAGAKLQGSDDDNSSGEQSELIGKPAPDFNLPLLDGGSARLSELTSTVVVLDFWASWCGPCRKGMPIIAKVAEKFAPQGVKVFAVNVMETTDTIRGFLKEEKLQLTVALDADGKAGKAYGAEAIPTTIVIGPDGRVQAVHVGLSPNLEKQLTSELEALLRGEDLAGKASGSQASPGAPADAVTTGSDALKKQWTAAGNWTGVGYDRNRSTILALRKGKYAEVDSAGTVKNEVSLNTDNNSLRLAYADESSPANLVTFTGWGKDVQAFAPDGKQLWSYPRGNGVDDVWAGNITGDQREEVVIGYNGSTGLHAVDPDGKQLWKYTGIGNVWHLCTGDVNGDGKAEVISTSARGQVHVFDAAGKKMKDISPGFYASMVRFAAGADGPRVYVTGSSDDGEMLAAFDFQGTEKWRVKLHKGEAHVDSAAVSPAGDMVAIGMRGGNVVVAATATGNIIGKVSGQGNTPEVAWAEVKSGDTTSTLLLAATGDELNAFALSEGGGVDGVKSPSATEATSKGARSGSGNKRITSAQFLKMVRGKTVREVRDLLGKPFSFAAGDEYAMYYNNPVAGMEIYDPDMDTTAKHINISFEGGKVMYVYYSDEFN